MKILLISSSLNDKSKSRLLAEEAKRLLGLKDNVDLDYLDLRDFELPMCDGGKAYGHPNVIELSARVKAADGFVVATPIYNYSGSGAFKNFMDLTGNDWKDKFVGFLAAAGGAMSYMGVMDLANSLMLNSRVVVWPRYVYADGSAFEDGEIKNSQVIDRINLLIEEFVIFGHRMTLPIDVDSLNQVK